jgi:hypothetical protein
MNFPLHLKQLMASNTSSIWACKHLILHQITMHPLQWINLDELEIIHNYALKYQIGGI